MRKLILALLFSVITTAALAFPSSHGIFFTWTNPSGTQGNDLYCGTATGSYSTTAIMHSTSPITSFDWLTTAGNAGTPGTKYFCAVTATAGGIESNFSTEVSATFPTVPSAPTAPAATAH